MADNIQVTQGTGTTMATDDIAGVQYPRVKVSWGADGTATDASVANPVPVQGTVTANAGTGNFTVTQASAASLNATVVGTGTFAVQAAQSGTWNVGNVTGTVSLPTGAATAAKQPAIGTAGTPAADVLTVQGAASMTALKVDGSAVTQPVSDGGGSLTVDGTVAATQSGAWSVALNAGTNGIGKLTANDGVDIGDVTVNNAAGSPVNSILRDSTGDSCMDDSNNALRVAIVSGGGSGGTASSFTVAFPATGTASGFNDGTNMQSARVFDTDTGAGTQYTLGVNLRKSASGGSVEFGTATDPVRVDPTGTTTQPVSDGGGSLTVDGTLAATQSGAWSVALNAGTNGIGKLTANDGVDIGDVTINNAANAAVNTILRDSTGDSCMDDSNNALRVAIVSGGGSGGTASSFAAAFPASGTAAGYTDGTNMQSARVFDTDSGAGTQYTLGVSLRKTASGGSVELGTATDPVRTDPTGTTTQPVSDGGSSLTVDNAGTFAVQASQTGTWNINNISGTVSLPTGAATETTLSGMSGKIPATLGQKTMANSMAVVVASDQSAVPVSGTVTANAGTGSFTVAQATAANLNATVVGTGTFAVQASQSGTWDVNNITGTVSLPTGAATETTLSGMSGKLPSTLGQKTMANSLAVAIASDQGNVPVISNNSEVRIEASFTRPANTTAYASGDLVANNVTAGSVVPLSFANAVRSAGDCVRIERVRIEKSGTSLTNASFRLHLFEASPTPTVGDNGVFNNAGVLACNNVLNYVGAFPVAMTNSGSDGAIGFGVPATGGGTTCSPTSGTTLYGFLEVTAAYTPASAEVFYVVIEGYRT